MRGPVAPEAHGRGSRRKAVAMSRILVSLEGRTPRRVADRRWGSEGTRKFSQISRRCTLSRGRVGIETPFGLALPGHGDGVAACREAGWGLKPLVDKVRTRRDDVA